MPAVKTLSQKDWDLIAEQAAKDANEKNESSHRGLYVVEGTGIVYYDNHPFHLPREEDRREDLIAEFRAFLTRSKLKQKACAYYPKAGASKDYTFAMVIQAEPYCLKPIRMCFLEIVDQFVNGYHEGIDLGHPADGETRRYTIPVSVLGEEVVAGRAFGKSSEGRMDQQSKTKTEAIKRRKRGQPALYPWDEWFKKDSHVFVRGVHYNCKHAMFITQLRNAAHQRGFGTKIIDGEAGNPPWVAVEFRKKKER